MKRRCIRQALSLMLLLPLLSFSACIYGGSSSGNAGPDSSGVLYGNGTGYGFRVLNLSVQKDSSVQFGLDNVAGETGSGFATKSAPTNGSLGINPDGTGVYQPNQGYEGLDQFSYTFQSSVSGSIQVNAYVDVRPCFRQPTQFPAAPNLQIISIFGTNTFPNTPSQSFTVTVQNQPTPVTLMLISQLGPMTWTIEAEPGAQIAKIVTSTPGTPAPQVVGAPVGTPIENISLPAYADNWTINASEDFINSYPAQPNYINKFGQMIGAIRNYFQQTETAFQGCYQASAATVPFTPATLASFCVMIPSYYNYQDQQCDGKCGPDSSGQPFDTWDTNDVTSNVSLSNSNLTFTVDSDSVSPPPSQNFGGPTFGPFPWGAGRALQGESCGKYYYEIHVDQGFGFQTGMGYKIFPFFPAGIIGLLPTPLALFPFAVRAAPRPGDTIGVAVDLDNGQIYYRYNGAWQNNADPGTLTNGIDLGLWTYDPVFPSIQMATSAAATANFGQAPMRDPAPSGFVTGFR